MSINGKNYRGIQNPFVFTKGFTPKDWVKHSQERIFEIRDSSFKYLLATHSPCGGIKGAIRFSEATSLFVWQSF